MRIPARSTLVGLFAPAAFAPPGLAQTPAPDLGQVPIEDLMRIEITSAARKEQRAADVAAAVSVISQDDIRRSRANAVSGVINVVTRTAAETQGGLVRLGLGTFDGSQVSARYGYRLQIGDRASLDVAAFRGHDDDLQTNEPSAPFAVSA